MQFQRKAVRIREEGHFFTGKGVEPDGLTGDSQLLQLRDRLIDIFYAESQMPESAGFRIIGSLGRIDRREDLQFRGIIDFQVQLPVFFVGTIVLPQNRKTELVNIKVFGNSIINRRSDRDQGYSESIYGEGSEAGYGSI